MRKRMGRLGVVLEEELHHKEASEEAAEAATRAQWEADPEGSAVDPEFMELVHQDLWAREELARTTKKVCDIRKGAIFDHVANEKQIDDVVCNRKFEVCKVFCIFEHENGQRECLKQLTTGALASFFNWTEVKEQNRFKGNVLAISEAPEPGDIIWGNLRNISYTKATGIRLRSTLFTLVIISIISAVIGFISTWEHEYTRQLTAMLVSLSKELIPGEQFPG